VTGSFWRMRFQVEGSTLRARAWADGTAEPTTWAHSVEDTRLAGAGAVGIRASHMNGSNAAPTILYDDFAAVVLRPADTTPPETTIVSRPADSSVSKSATFTFTASEPGSSFECSLDGAAFAACSSPKDYTNLSVGAHEFRVRGVDSTGNTDATPATDSWTVESALLASDPFERLVAAGASWGSAATGGAWTAQFTTGGSAYGVSGGQASIAKAAGSTYGQTLAVNKADVDVVARASWNQPAAGGNLIPFSLLGRYANGNNHYRAELRQTPAGALQLAIVKIVSGQTTVIASAKQVAASYTVGSFWRMRFQIDGQTLRARAWADGTAEPNTWTHSVDDSQLGSAGAVGIRASHMNGSTAAPTILYDDFGATALQPLP
jgi:hypothetical protein